MRLRPFFPYYGAKWRLARTYPFPRFERVIEPFAGAAGYATLHYRRQVVLYDANPAIAGIWMYLINARQSEILALPDVVNHIDELRGVAEEARNLIGFWLNTAQAYPCKVPSVWARSGRWPRKFWGAHVRERLAMQVEWIRHWRVFCAGWEDAGSEEATWFVDPPYSGPPGAQYKVKLKPEDYQSLAGWCQAERGQVIVCENDGATWLPFRAHRNAHAMKGRSIEVVWTNDDSDRPQLNFNDALEAGGGAIP